MSKKRRAPRRSGPNLVEIRYSYRAVIGDEAIHFDVLVVRLRGDHLDYRITLRGEAEQIPGEAFAQVIAALEDVKGRVKIEELAETADD